MRLQKRLLRIGLITGGLVDDAAAVTAGVSHQNDAVSAIRFNAKLNYAKTDRNARPHCFTIDQQSYVKYNVKLYEKDIIPNKSVSLVEGKYIFKII